MSSQPVFGSEDRVRTTQTELPAELRGVTDPVKIAQYYQAREATLRDELRRAATPPPRTTSTIEQRTDTPPAAPVTFSPAEATAARGTLIETAKRTAMAGKTYWSRLEADILKIMGQQPPENQVDVNVWETAYNTLVGMNLERLLREDRETTEAAARSAAERAQTPAQTIAAPLPLPVEVTAKILPGLNISEEQYRTAQNNINNGVWPLTSDNVGGKRRTIGGN